MRVHSFDVMISGIYQASILGVIEVLGMHITVT
jgi:hypothetical protein